eukprot:CAMPEP_0194267148 /NCGR_PEP_ID=MMETSP0169-20130528/1779_1 /TAXON_ID=218684 /ORGANISM="Corethron pennatum, Strain L29A3" /LENGTH=328 /DNA_ID=CAMNT_0039007957 /DNA_START=260 /DNA_END=1246 /DNA_ORIENTATION=-
MPFAVLLFFAISNAVCAEPNTVRLGKRALHNEGVIRYPAKDCCNVEVGSPMNVASGKASKKDKRWIDPRIQSDLNIDLEGIWWMSDNPLPENLMSFAGSHGPGAEESPLTFPATLNVPNSRMGSWSWDGSAAGTTLRKLYGVEIAPGAGNFGGGNPEFEQTFLFNSTTVGEIKNVALTDALNVDSYNLYKYTSDCDVTSGSKENCDPEDCAPTNSEHTCAELIETYPDDMWSRPTVFKPWVKDLTEPWKFFMSLVRFTIDEKKTRTVTYTLKRIVYGNGTHHPVFWDEFTAQQTLEMCTGWWWWRECSTVIGGKRLQSYSSDDVQYRG